MKKNNKGITLIALVVTIVVLLILAGIAIMALTGENGILNRAADAKLINEKAKVEELIKMSYMSKKIDALGETPLKETVISEIIKDLRENGYAGEDDIKTVTNAGSTYSGIEMTDGVEVIDTTGNELSKITLMQGQSKTFTVSLQRTAGESKVYVKIQGKYYEIICTDTSISLSENGETSVAGEEYTIKVTPPSDNTATITLVSETITEETELVSGTTLTVTATQNMGLATFNINVYSSDGVTKTAEKTGTIDTVLLPKRPTSVSVSSAGNATSIEKGSDLQLSVSTSPYSTEEMTDTINWSIQSGSGVATVSQTGLVHAVTTGSVTIRASAVSQTDSSDVSAYGEITLTVTPKMVSITIQSEDTSKGIVDSSIAGTKSYEEGSQITLTATPASGYEFDGWYIGSNTTAITTNPYSYQVPINSSATTIAAKFKEEEVAITGPYFKTENNVAKYYSSPSDTTGTEITASNMGQYLGKKVSYTPASTFSDRGKSSTYRIFYIDVGTGTNGKYGDGKGTIYLKADYDKNNKTLNSIDTTNKTDINVMSTLNPMWNATYSTSGYDNAKYTKYLLDKGIWNGYKDTAGIANYVVGAPSLEMWVDSYNAFLAKNQPTSGTYYAHNCTVTQDTTNGPTGANKGKGYYIGYNNAYADNSGWYTKTYTFVNPDSYSSTDLKDRVCAWGKGTYWLASPSATDSDRVVYVHGGYGDVGGAIYSNFFAFCPLVSCNSGVAISEAQ